MGECYTARKGAVELVFVGVRSGGIRISRKLYDRKDGRRTCEIGAVGVAYVELGRWGQHQYGLCSGADRRLDNGSRRTQRQRMIKGVILMI